MDPFLGQIVLFGGNFAPVGWMQCQGQLLPISQYSALFSLLGTVYGGDGRNTFALPDLRGRAPIGYGHGAGLESISLGRTGGSNTNTLLISQLPSHNHSPSLTLGAEGIDASLEATAANNYLGNASNDTPYRTTAGSSTLSGINSQNVGGNQPVNNMQPYIGMNYIIATYGTYPSRD